MPFSFASSPLSESLEQDTFLSKRVYTGKRVRVGSWGGASLYKALLSTLQTYIERPTFVSLAAEIRLVIIVRFVKSKSQFNIRTFSLVGSKCLRARSSPITNSVVLKLCVDIR